MKDIDEHKEGERERDERERETRDERETRETRERETRERELESAYLLLRLFFFFIKVIRYSNSFLQGHIEIFPLRRFVSSWYN